MKHRSSPMKQFLETAVNLQLFKQVRVAPSGPAGGKDDAKGTETSQAFGSLLRHL